VSRNARWVFAIALAQVTAVAVYWLVESQRALVSDEALGTEPPQRVEMPMPSLAVERRDGTRSELVWSGQRTLVHVWATWCLPCRAELPSLLAVPWRHDVHVVAVALNRSWDDVERFLGSTSSSNVVLGRAEDVEGALGVRTLPVTFLVESDGRLALRFDGARDWANEAFVQSSIGGWVDDL
jgi:thiol-disulfide isomerase/thioredoxin